MTKLKLLLVACLLILLKDASGQSYEVRYHVSDADSSLKASIGLKEKFSSRIEASIYINTITNVLYSKGYITASLDSLRMDSTIASVQLFLGQQYHWAKINTSSGDEDILSALHWPQSSFKNTTMDWATVKKMARANIKLPRKQWLPFWAGFAG